MKHVTRAKAIELIANEYDKLTHAELLDLVKKLEVETLEEYSNLELKTALYSAIGIKLEVVE